MLKTLRITSLIALVLAVCGVLFIVFWGLRENPDIIAYLDSPGVVKQFEDKVTDGGKKELKSPLVDEAHKFALRIDPPPLPKPPMPDKPKPEPKESVKREPPKPEPPGPKGPINAKFTLLATVLCETDSSRSMVLLRQTGNKEEWFWQGERVGNLDIDEVRNGSAIFSQGGRSPQELFVPAKPQTKSLLKAEGTASASSVTGSSSIDVQLGPGSGTSATASAVPSAVNRQPGSVSGSSGLIRIERDRDVSTVRDEISSRIKQVRTVPEPRTPAEQRASIESNIQNIQNIMNQESSSVNEEQREKENEAWMKLLSALQSEKETLKTAEALMKEQNETSEADDKDVSEADTQPTDPNEK